MNRSLIIALFVGLVITMSFFAGCSGTSSPNAATPTTTQHRITYTPTTPIQSETTIETQAANAAVLSSVTELVVSAVQDTWDNDIQYDGNEITLYFRDAEDHPVEWENGPEVPVNIEIWMTESGSNSPLERQKVQLVYEKSGTMTSTFYRFRVPFEDTPIPPGTQGEAFYPAVYAKATTPDGKTYEAMETLGLKSLN